MFAADVKAFLEECCEPAASQYGVFVDRVLSWFMDWAATKAPASSDQLQALSEDKRGRRFGKAFAECGLAWAKKGPKRRPSGSNLPRATLLIKRQRVQPSAEASALADASS